MPFYDWPTDRGARLAEEGAIDIIVNCRHRRQVPKFAAKYKMSESWVEQMRRGRGYTKLRQKLREDGRLQTGRRP